MNAEQIGAAVAAALTTRGIPATLEYPGFVAVPDQTSGGTWCWGTANAHWGANLLLLDGDSPQYVETSVLSGSQDVPAIADAIERALVRTPVWRVGILERAHAVIALSDGADEHADLIRELGTVIASLEDEWERA